MKAAELIAKLQELKPDQEVNIAIRTFTQAHDVCYVPTRITGSVIFACLEEGYVVSQRRKPAVLSHEEAKAIRSQAGERVEFWIDYDDNDSSHSVEWVVPADVEQHIAHEVTRMYANGVYTHQPNVPTRHLVSYARTAPGVKWADRDKLTWKRLAIGVRQDEE